MDVSFPLMLMVNYGISGGKKRGEEITSVAVKNHGGLITNFLLLLLPFTRFARNFLPLQKSLCKQSHKRKNLVEVHYGWRRLLDFQLEQKIEGH